MNLNLDAAIKKAGGRVPLAKELKVGRQAIYNWVQQGFVPPARAIEIEQKFGVDRLLLIKPSLRALVATPNAKN